MLVLPKSLSAVLVIIRSKSVSICNRSRAKLVDSSRNRTFGTARVPYPNLMHLYGGLLAQRLMLKISWRLCLSPVISTQFTLEMYVAALNREKKITKFILGFKVVQGHRCWYHLLSTNLAREWLQIDTDLAAYHNKHCWRAFRGYQHRWPWTTLNPQNRGFSKFLATLGCNTHFKSELPRNHSR